MSRGQSLPRIRGPRAIDGAAIGEAVTAALRAERRRRGQNRAGFVADLAERLGLDASQMRSVENWYDGTACPRLASLFRLLAVLSVDFADEVMAPLTGKRAAAAPEARDLALEEAALLLGEASRALARGREGE